MNQKISTVWFRNDLRLHDHEPLTRAIAESDLVIPVYIIDPSRWKMLDPGFRKTGPFQTRFILESLTDLKKSLQKKHTDLVILKGSPEEILLPFAKAHHCTTVFTSKEATWEELQDEEKVKQVLNASGIQLKTYWHSTLYHIEDLPWPVRNLPNAFTRFRKENENITAIRNTLSLPNKILSPHLEQTKVPTLSHFGFDEKEARQDERTTIECRGGENAAWTRLNEYFWEKDLLKNYKNTRDGLIGRDYSTKLSLWLAHGCISPRAIHEAIWKYEAKVKRSTPVNWLLLELLRRDYFRFVCKKFGTRIFRKSGFRDTEIELKHNTSYFEQWRLGQTGVPFVDANMRELLHTGYLSNIGRKNVAGFLTKDLKVDWRWGAAWFESQLIDYDVCNNWGNWMYAAGVGNDQKENRYFNIISQALKYDSGGNYVRIWLPELNEIPGNKIHYPSELIPKEMRSYGIELGVDYPKPLIDISKWFEV